MKAALRGLSCDVLDVSNYIPQNPECFCLTLLAKIGVEGQESSDNFEFFVCTPDWIKKYLNKNFWGRNYLIVNSFDIEYIRSAVTDMLDGIEANSWNGLAKEISHFMDWEYRNYGM